MKYSHGLYTVSQEALGQDMRVIAPARGRIARSDTHCRDISLLKLMPGVLALSHWRCPAFSLD